MTTQLDVSLPDGRTLHVYDTGQDAGAMPVCWHHGTPNIGPPPSPLFDIARQFGLRWFSTDRAGYGGSSPHPDRTVASVAVDTAAAADALGIDRFAVVGHSGGGPHALACAAVLGDRVVASVAVSGLAPYDAADLDWFAGMAEVGVGSNSAAAQGRAARQAWQETAGDGDFGFTAGDEEALGGRWAWVLDVVQPAIDAGPAAAIDDDLAMVTDWGFAVDDISSPVLVVHGDSDRVVPVSHGRWLADHIPGAELWVRPSDGHITVLDAMPDALSWLTTKGVPQAQPARLRRSRSHSRHDEPT